jgi:two-component system invasion response regulator UvrY
MATVLIVDDQALVRRGLREVLTNAPLINEIGEARNGIEALAQARAHHWDLVLLDISMPGVNGVQVLKKLRSERPDIRVIMFSFYADARVVRMCLQAGAAGYLTKESGPDELMDAIHVVLAGGVYVSRALSDEVQGDGDTLPPNGEGPSNGSQVG